MSRLVSQEHWEFWLGNMPKPEDATLEMLWAAHDAMLAIEQEEEDVKWLKWYQESKEYYEKKIARIVRDKEFTDNYEQRIATLKSILGTIDEGIQILTERLTQ